MSTRIVTSIVLFFSGFLMAAFYLDLLIEDGERAHAFLESACIFFTLGSITVMFHLFKTGQLKRRNAPPDSAQHQNHSGDE